MSNSILLKLNDMNFIQDNMGIRENVEDIPNLPFLQLSNTLQIVVFTKEGTENSQFSPGILPILFVETTCVLT